MTAPEKASAELRTSVEFLNTMYNLKLLNVFFLFEYNMLWVFCINPLYLVFEGMLVM